MEDMDIHCNKYLQSDSDDDLYSDPKAVKIMGEPSPKYSFLDESTSQIEDIDTPCEKNLQSDSDEDLYSDPKAVKIMGEPSPKYSFLDESISQMEDIDTPCEKNLQSDSDDDLYSDPKAVKIMGEPSPKYSSLDESTSQMEDIDTPCENVQSDSDDDLYSEPKVVKIIRERIRKYSFLDKSTSQMEDIDTHCEKEFQSYSDDEVYLDPEEVKRMGELSPRYSFWEEATSQMEDIDTPCEKNVQSDSDDDLYSDPKAVKIMGEPSHKYSFLDASTSQMENIDTPCEKNVQSDSDDDLYSAPKVVKIMGEPSHKYSFFDNSTSQMEDINTPCERVSDNEINLNSKEIEKTGEYSPGCSYWTQSTVSQMEDSDKFHEEFRKMIQKDPDRPQNRKFPFDKKELQSDSDIDCNSSDSKDSLSDSSSDSSECSDRKESTNSEIKDIDDLQTANEISQHRSNLKKHDSGDMKCMEFNEEEEGERDKKLFLQMSWEERLKYHVKKIEAANKKKICDFITKKDCFEDEEFLSDSEEEENLIYLEPEDVEKEKKLLPDYIRFKMSVIPFLKDIDKLLDIHLKQQEHKYECTFSGKLTEMKKQMRFFQLTDVDVKQFLREMLQHSKREALLIRRVLENINIIRSQRYLLLSGIEIGKHFKFIHYIREIARSVPIWKGLVNEIAPPLCGAIRPPKNHKFEVSDLVVVHVVLDAYEQEVHAELGVIGKWILAVVSEVNSEMYTVIDMDGSRQKYNVPKRKLIALPHCLADPKTNPETIFPDHSLVLAIYSGTTCFFPGVVTKSPKKRGDYYGIRFRDFTTDSSEWGVETEVEQLFVVPFKDVYSTVSKEEQEFLLSTFGKIAIMPIKKPPPKKVKKPLSKKVKVCHKILNKNKKYVGKK